MQAVFGLVILVLVGVMIVIALASNWGSIWATITGAPPSTQLITPPAQIKPIAQPTVGTRVIANAPPPTKKIGIISGHRGNDSGSVCADGWTEAELVYQTSVGVASQLRARGYSVDILDEYDNRLEGYNARLLLSIHADSCTYYHEYLTGFKIARSEISAIPETEDKLVACLRDRYGKATGLKWNANTITHNMTLYHAHRKVTTQTPSVIFELGFMYLDREILQKRNGKLVDGIVEGVMCFTENDTK
jgi:N-acetylmuramoyl-L-alanine amidase